MRLAIGLALLTVTVTTVALAQTEKRRVPQSSSTRAERGDPPPATARPTRSKQASREYVRVGRDYRHVRVERAPRLSDGRLDSRAIIVRSARVGRRPLAIFPKQDVESIDVVVRCFREGRRDDGFRAWGRFVAGLRDYELQVDLDDVMYYVAREGVSAERDPGLRLYSEKLAYIRDSIDRLETYLDDLTELRDDARRPGGAGVYRDIEGEWRLAAADRDRLLVHEEVLSDDFERALRASDAYERDFTGLFEGLFREAELVIRVSSDDGPRRKVIRP